MWLRQQHNGVRVIEVTGSNHLQLPTEFGRGVFKFTSEAAREVIDACQTLSDNDSMGCAVCLVAKRLFYGGHHHVAHHIALCPPVVAAELIASQSQQSSATVIRSGVQWLHRNSKPSDKADLPIRGGL